MPANRRVIVDRQFFALFYLPAWALGPLLLIIFALLSKPDRHNRYQTGVELLQLRHGTAELAYRSIAFQDFKLPDYLLENFAWEDELTGQKGLPIVHKMIAMTIRRIPAALTLLRREKPL